MRSMEMTKGPFGALGCGTSLVRIQPDCKPGGEPFVILRGLLTPRVARGYKNLSSNQSPPAQAGDAVIEVRDVHFSAGGRKIFDGLTVTARRGRITAFMGPSGTGKTTLLRLITGQAQAESGSVKVWGDEVSRLSSNDLFALRRRMGMLFQN